MVRAINKHGIEASFSERVWAMMPKHKNGWVEFSEQGEVLVPQQVMEFQLKKKEAVAVEDVNIEPEIKAEPMPEEPKTAPTKVHTARTPRKPSKRPKK